jgi:hypothetical protein
MFDRVSVPDRIGVVGEGWVPGITGIGHPELSLWINKSIEDEANLEKALTTGANIVQVGDTGGTALRMQFLHDELEYVSFNQDDAKLMKLLPKKTVGSTTFEWTIFNQYGGPGDGFVSETGSDGAFGVSGADDNFVRQFQRVHYMATQRTVGLVAQMVNNITNPMKAAEQGANFELLAKQNLASYWGAETLSTNQFNGMAEQILAWVRTYSSDSAIIYDAGGLPVDKDMLTDITKTSRKKFGRPSLWLTSVDSLADTQKLLFPEQRAGEGDTGSMGINKREFVTSNAGNGGKLKLDDDVMLRPNRPLVADGNGIDGKPRSATTADSGALAFAATPFAACAAQAAGTGNYWSNVNLNTDSAILGTAPNVPTTGAGGNAGNRLSAGTYYYALAPVYQGKEGVAWVYGAATAGTVTGATGVSPTAGQIVKIDVDLTTPCITGLGSTYARNLVKWRVYRALSTATGLSDFDYLCDIGNPSAGNARGYDNGMYIPGSDNGFSITESKNGASGWGLYSLMPLIKRPLPHLAMADLFALLWFGTFLFLAPRHQIWVRNIGQKQ